MNLDKEDIISRYKSGEPGTKIAKHYDVCSQTIYNYLEKWNIDRRKKTRKYNVNDKYFSRIDSLDKAYWLGFILADGSIDDTHNVLKVLLSSKDKVHLRKLKSSLEAENPICSYSDKESKNKSTLQITSRKLVNDLKNLGVRPRKSRSIGETINIPENLQSHFWRGVIDGDGNFSKSEDRITLVGNRQTIKDFCSWVTSLVPSATTTPRNYNVWTAPVYGEASRIIAQNLYENSTSKTRLKRKYKTANNRYGI